MQIRKRAKSVSFGKPEKTKEPEHHIEEKKDKVTAAPIVEKVEEEEKVVEPTHAAKKVQDETAIVENKESELSVTPLEESEDAKIETPKETITPPEQFLTDSPSPTATETVSPKEVKPPEPLIMEPISTNPPISDSLAPIQDQKPAEQTMSEELSPTPPTSAFTIQGNNVDTTLKDDQKKKNFVVYFLVVALISFALGLAAMAAVSYFGLLSLPLPKFSMNNLQNMSLNKPTPTSIPTSVPTEAPTAKPVDLKTYTITILNGSGIKGKAAEAKTSLTTAGFKVGTTGNADRSDYTTTQIAAKKNVDKTYLDKLQTELKKDYKLETVSTIPSDSTQTTDVIVTLGKITAN